MADRSHSEEAYVVGLLEEILGEPARRGHRFDWLRGDPTARGRGVPLPVDAYWPTHKLVVEVYERQHDEPVAHFDKVERVTVSGVHRGEQRRIYDQRRRDLLPAHGLTLLIVRTSDLAVDRRGRLLRDAAADRPVLAELVRGAIDGASPTAKHESSAMPPLVDVTAVRVVRDYVLELVFETGETRVIDMADRLFGALFEPLRADYELFRQVGVDAGTIVWPTGADWDPGELYDKSAPVTLLDPASQDVQAGEAAPTTSPARGARAGAAASDPMDTYFADVGPFYDAPGARRQLGGVSRAGLRALVAACDVLELQTGEGVRVYPAWQFTGRSVRPELLQAFHALRGLDGWVAAAWLASPHPDLEGRSPREALREGVDAGLVATIAHRDAR